MALIFFLATMPRPSMKALPRRKGNSGFGWGGWFFGASMKALPSRKGNIFVSIATPILLMPQ